ALIELVAESLQLFFRTQSIVRPRAHLSAAEKMDLEFVDFREVALERPEIMLVFSELMERARRDERVAAAIVPIKKKWRQMLVELLSEGVREGAYRKDLDPDAFATVLMSTMIGFCRNSRKEAGAYERLVAELKRAMRNPQDAPASELSNAAALAR